ncbi:ATP-binding cassette domain-containing protein [Acidisoma cellulosilytica]|uniref:ATP-binding cassette domain-containing protein n=2 Tax=Acidisoma cellulosilyticum TaxID=2802395 RepID=A0A963Z2J0_9PROT|nr:ATP-binding cassette domain-containing protein [Acidisoma cellulosilyticum]
MAVAAGSVALLGVSGWFITACALAGLAGPIAAGAFNYVLPAAIIRLCAILRTGGRYAERVIGHDAALGALARLRPKLFAAILAAPVERALSLSVGDASSRMVQDVDVLEARFVRLPVPWGLAAGVLAGLAMLVPAGIAPAAATLGILVMTLGLGWVLAWLSAEVGRDVQRSIARLKDRYAALVSSASELRAYGLEDWAAQEIARESEALLRAQKQLTAWGGWFALLQAMGAGIAAMLAMALSAHQSLPLAAMAALGAAMTVDCAGPFLRGLEARGSWDEAARRLDRVLDNLPSPIPAAVSLSDRPDIRLLRPGARLVPGSVTGLTGRSGIGKTTILEQLVGLRADEAVTILLDGLPLPAIDLARLRATFSFAPQDAAMLSGTVRDNLLLAATPATSDDDLWQVLEDAVLAETVRGLPQGLDTWIGENGAVLSGGERRRLNLARAYLRAAPWLLLDEPTAGLDAVTEQRVVERLRARLAGSGQGAIIVSHRPAPLALCTSLITLTESGAEILGLPGWGPSRLGDHSLHIVPIV